RRIAKFKAAIDSAWNSSLAWTPDGTRLFSGGSSSDPTIREWDASTWKQVGEPWRGHTDNVSAIAVNPTGTLVATASSDNHVRLWRLSGQCIAIFMDSRSVSFVTFSADGRQIFSGGVDTRTSEWEVPALMVDAPKEQASEPEPSTQSRFFKKLFDVVGTVRPPISTSAPVKAKSGKIPLEEALLEAQKV
ncbi:hypothetical protein AZE42_05543, partial [Rhizopogon vesiculosus]